MAVIGKYFAEQWQWALRNEYEFYTPQPNASMTMEDLLSIQTTLTDLVAYWSNQILSNTNVEAVANAQAITDLEQSKLDTVTSIIDLKQGEGATEVAVMDPISQPQSKDNTMLWVIGGLIGLGLLYKFSKKKKRSYQ